MKQLPVFLSNISSQVNESSGNFIRSDLIRVSCVVVSCFHRTYETVLWVPHLLQHRQDLKSWPLCDVLSVWILPSGRRYDFWKKQKNKCQINMSKANLNNSIIEIFINTYCSSGDPVFAQFHAFCTLYSCRSNKLPYSTNVIFRQFTVQYWTIRCTTQWTYFD
jgi:hypothetical protein